MSPEVNAALESLYPRMRLAIRKWIEIKEVCDNAPEDYVGEYWQSQFQREKVVVHLSALIHAVQEWGQDL